MREMLQIMLFILKLIGWILLLILGLLILIFVAALFIPLRYQAETSCKGKLSTLEAGVNFRVLFRLVDGHLRYQDGKLSWNIRAAWIRLGNAESAEDLEENVKEKIEEAATAAAEVEEEMSEHLEEQAEEAVKQKPENTAAIEEKDKEQKSENTAAAIEEKAEKMPENPAREKTDHIKTHDTDESEQNAKESLSDKIACILEKIKYTFNKICDKIRMLLKKAEIVKAFLTDDVHQSAFLKCLVELKKMVIRMRPKRIGGEVHFGFEDPSLTGRVLAGASMLYPYWGEHVRCCPDFENEILEGEVSVKGSLRLFPAAILIWNLLWNKNVRKTIMDVKRLFFK